MAKSVRPEQLGAAISGELTMYHANVLEKVNKLSDGAAKELVKITKSSAPVGARGKYRKSIASKRIRASAHGDTYAWYVRPPEYRLTHLLEKGHFTRAHDGSRTKAFHFLESACDTVLPKYEQDVKEACKG